MSKTSATVLPGCVAAAALLASGSAAAGWQSGDTRLPGTPVVAHAPDGWVCSADGGSFFEGTTASLLSCLPKGGGISFDLQKIVGSHRPASIEAYMRELLPRAASQPSSFASLPQRFEVAGRPAVESASRGRAFLDTFGIGNAKSSTVEMISDTAVVEDHGEFYQCSFSAMPMQYTDAVRQTYRNFCNSITFDGP
ncbi:hypothetical protein IHE49_03220 [Rhodanobacter sp. 7MK24]|uniref:hypothetical protein n=1 Tax=Rhodanobacter sp. 7MK24 TaxID=2775922 RepID=UPI00177CAC65|nr:hypothetical protein [Rhodanobacter sp. 7MK24]MBD8879486.1 hypothetical protein [Rhodanobacter sp. 7MK24]